MNKTKLSKSKNTNSATLKKGGRNSREKKKKNHLKEKETEKEKDISLLIKKAIDVYILLAQENPDISIHCCSLIAQ